MKTTSSNGSQTAAVLAVAVVVFSMSSVGPPRAALWSAAFVVITGVLARQCARGSRGVSDAVAASLGSAHVRHG